MSRSFQVRTEKYSDFTAEELLNTFKTLRDSDKEIDFENIHIINHSEIFKILITKYCIVHMDFHDIEFDGKSHKYWHVDSRAIDGMGKNLFVACASALAILMDGYASSGDGAFTPDIDFTGNELWETYLDSRPHFTVSTMHGDTLCRSKSAVIEIIASSMYNDIAIYSDSEFPKLAILVNGYYTCIHYFAGDRIFQSAGDLNKKITFNAGGTEWTAPPETVVTLEDAVYCVDSFLDTFSCPECIEWTEL